MSLIRKHVAVLQAWACLDLVIVCLHAKTLACSGRKMSQQLQQQSQLQRISAYDVQVSVTDDILAA